jgi:hypothetical protein
MKPSIGTIVYYKATDRDTQPKPAMILTFDGEKADLDVFGAGLVQYGNSAMAANFNEAKGGEWCLPEQA